ncbi:hypothetical protein TNCV_4085351 [Trichonephila clavipes]|nr:hypothetical protein TNCV_4085351 [Trichonephila clavipes]
MTPYTRAIGTKPFEPRSRGEDDISKLLYDVNGRASTDLPCIRTFSRRLFGSTTTRNCDSAAAATRALEGRNLFFCFVILRTPCEQTSFTSSHPRVRSQWTFFSPLRCPASAIQKRTRSRPRCDGERNLRELHLTPQQWEDSRKIPGVSALLNDSQRRNNCRIIGSSPNTNDPLGHCPIGRVLRMEIWKAKH